MKNQKNLKKKNVNYRIDQEEIRIREKKKMPNDKYRKQSIYSMIDDEEEDFDLYKYSDEEE